jgi:DNA-directed RNA polymerase specialized sigma24 family protein
MRHVREVLRLRFVGGVPTREIARRIGIAPSTVRTSGEQARRMRRLLKGPREFREFRDDLRKRKT